MRSTRRHGPSRRPPILAIALLLPLVGACAAPEAPEVTPALVAPEPQRHVASSCAPGGPRLILDWADVGDDGRAHVGEKLTLSLVNNKDQALEAELTLRIHADGRVIRKSLGRQTVAPLSTTAVAVDLAAMDIVAADLTYAAQIFVDAALFDGAERHGAASTEAAYFHAEPGTSKLLVYRESAYRDTFGAGDFRGRRAGRSREAGVEGVGVAHLATAAELHGDPMDGR